MSKALEKVMDAVDIETFLVCDSEEEARKISMQMMNELGFCNASIVFIQYLGPGARVRVRGYIYKPGERYNWFYDENNSQ
ncbi:hypothetical protein L1766_07060 [Thermovorax subterraneus]|jgi:hypothetical protein|nr:hypothetical protein [Thermovorax subterraneus]